MTGATERNAYVCYKCEPPARVFLATHPKKPPLCPQHTAHGAMQRQVNRPYARPK